MIPTFLTSLGAGGAAAGLIKLGTGLLTVLLVVPALIRLFLVTVDEGQAAIRTRNGKPIVRRRAVASRYRHGARRGQIKHLASPNGEVVVLHPGTHGAFPLLWWYRRIDVRTRARDLPARTLTTAGGHQVLVHASIEWRPVTDGHHLRTFELAVCDVDERVANIASGALRDVVLGVPGPTLPAGDAITDLVLAHCRARVLEDCGVDLLRATVTGDALTDGHLLARAIATHDDHGVTVVPLPR